MEHESQAGISFFQRYLTLWVLLCMVVGVAIGYALPAVPAFLDTLQVMGISIPIAILIWVMIYPMMMKVDFQSIKNVGKNPSLLPCMLLPGSSFLSFSVPGFRQTWPGNT